MKKIFNNKLFIFLMGVILSGGVTYAATFMATNISYDNSNSHLNTNNVQEAIDLLYTKANTSYEEYNGETTYTPGSSTITIPTNNKIMKSDIVINAIPSTYKNLQIITDATTSDIVKDKLAYNSNGDLMSGSHVEQCINSAYNKAANSQINISLGFKPSKFFINLIASNKLYTVNYDSGIDSNVRVLNATDNTVSSTGGTIGGTWIADNSGIKTNFATTYGWYTYSYTVNYVACR